MPRIRPARSKKYAWPSERLWLCSANRASSVLAGRAMARTPTVSPWGPRIGANAATRGGYRASAGNELSDGSPSSAFSIAGVM